MFYQLNYTLTTRNECIVNSNGKNANDKHKLMPLWGNLAITILQQSIYNEGFQLSPTNLLSPLVPMYKTNPVKFLFFNRKGKKNSQKPNYTLIRI